MEPGNSWGLVFSVFYILKLKKYDECWIFMVNALIPKNKRSKDCPIGKILILAMLLQESHVDFPFASL